MVPRMQLLLVEDDPAMQATLQRSLARRGMEVTALGDGRAALAQWASRPPDAVVLDLTLPGLDGLQVLQQARARGLRTPVLLLTARGTVGDRVLGLNAGADDYLPKPFDLDELEARLRALVRRLGDLSEARPPAPSTVSIGAIRYEKDSGAIYRDGEVMELTPRELALMHALLAQPGHAVAKERLYELVFPGAAGRAVRGHRGGGVPAAQEAGRHRAHAHDAARAGLPAQGGCMSAARRAAP